MTIHFEILSWRNLESLRRIRNENKEWFKTIEEIDEQGQEWWFCEQYNQDRPEIIFLIKEGDSYIGAISIYDINNKIANIGRMMVKDEFKHKGYMSKALILMFEFAKRFLGLTELILEVKLSNVIARDFYTKFGFLTTGYTKYTLIMKKVL